MQISNCRELDPTVYHWCPTKRYCSWANHTMDVRSFFTSDIGYSEMDWNYIQINPLETTYFGDLNATVQTGLGDLGYVEDTHDCCLGHYESYDWIDFDVEDGYGEVFTSLQQMGYDEGSWTNSTATQWDDMWWDELPLEIQYAAYDGLCYTRELWNLIPTTLWPEETFEYPSSYYISNLDDDTLFDTFENITDMDINVIDNLAIQSTNTSTLDSIIAEESSTTSTTPTVSVIDGTVAENDITLVLDTTNVAVTASEIAVNNTFTQEAVSSGVDATLTSITGTVAENDITLALDTANDAVTASEIAVNSTFTQESVSSGVDATLTSINAKISTLTNTLQECEDNCIEECADVTPNLNFLKCQTKCGLDCLI